VPTAEGQRSRSPEAHLVEDLAGLFLSGGVDVVALEAGEGFPVASVGSAISVIHAVNRESRPNTVMNHGAPAAMMARSGWLGSKIRSAPRSSPAEAMLLARSV
jgi:hypothetical protein